MRRLLVLVSSIIFVDALLFGALTPLIPGYADEFGLSKTGAGLLVAAFGAGALLGGIPGGIAALHIGPKRTVIFGLCLLAAASFAFAVADEAWTLGLARFAQGISSTTTWAGALAWLTVETPPGRRGETIGTAFGAAVFGAILGPMFGAGADAVGVTAAFAAVGVGALMLAAWAGTGPTSHAEPQPPGALAVALHDVRFLGGLWLNALPALLFGTLVVLAPLALADGGFSPLAIGLVFLTAGLVEVVVNPVLGRYSDRVGRLLPIRFALGAAVVVSTALAFADGARSDRFARLRRGRRVRWLLHAGNGARLRPGRGRWSRPGPCFRRHEHGVGARQRHGARGGRRPGRAFRRRRAVCARRRPLPAHPAGRAVGRTRPPAHGGCRGMKREDWNRRYAEPGLLWSAAPNRFLVSEVNELAPGRALDLACGEGRNAVWLAERGWNVVGVDYSDAALAKAAELAAERGVAVDLVNSDLLDYAPEQRAFDLVCVLYLQLPAAERRRILERAAGAVASGGAFLLVGHDLTNLEHGHGGPSDPEVLLTPEDVAAELPGLDVVKAERVLRPVEGASRPAIDALVRAHRFT